MIAVNVHKGYKYYGRSSDPNKKIVLDSLDMNVMNGSIYGLLGASGCGKTTLLSCIVGRRKLNSGTINVLGGEPGEKGSGVPGPRVGYMPQEIALLLDFSISETIFYFGRIYGMPESRIHERFNTLVKLLDLPDPKRMVGKLSGGQQRRLSFACALVHEPELLILDEPTVGLDPLLRERIWDYLLDTTKTTKLAVIITTHYIEEAKMAHRVGLMRNGILLAEDAPSNITRKFNCDSLEDAFLQFCLRHGTSEACGVTNHIEVTNSNSLQPIDVEATDIITDLPSGEDLSKKRSPRRNKSFQEMRQPGFKGAVAFTSTQRMKALLSKNFLQIVRQPAHLLFCFVFPIVQISCFYASIGGNPKDLKIGIVNEEVQSHLDCFNETLITTFAHDETCDFNKISCRFISEMEDEMASRLYYNSHEDAFTAAQRGDVIGYVHIRPNFTEAITQTLLDGSNALNESFVQREISIRLDKSDQQITYFLERRLRDAFKRFAENLMTDCEYPKGLATIPVTFKTPIHGSFKDQYTVFAEPGVLMTTIFFIATIGTSTVFITERLDGIWDRVLVAGITTLELLFAHLITQMIVVLLQSAETLLFATFIFGSENKGDYLAIMVMLSINGFSGMLLGLLISITCDSHTTASFVATGFFYPMLILCGIMWPIEGMPNFLQYLSLAFPFTIPSISMRNILVKGWSVTNSQVYDGFVILIAWNIAFAILCVLGLKLRKL